ncbi:MAG: hypothetical protein AAGE52_18410 [Myxococcota bacterium]
MGYDCTLHVIDPASLDAFADHFLGNASDAAFERAYDVPSLYAKVRDAIEGDPREGGRFVLQAALFFASTRTPHLPSRGFCLGLWDRFFDDPLPVALHSFSDAAPALSKITAAYPALASNLHTGIVGNYEVGHYTPPDKVPQLLAYVEEEVAHAKQSLQPTFAPVLRVLRVAAEKGFGYWEATDLDVASAHSEWLALPKAPPPPVTAELLRLPLKMASVLAFFPDRLVMAADEKVHIVDTRTGEVRASAEGSYAGADATRDGRLFALGAGFVNSAIFEVDTHTGEGRRLSRDEESSVGHLRAIGDRLLVAPPIFAGGPADGRGPAWLEDGALRPIELPPPSSSKRIRWGVTCFEALGLADDHLLVLWGKTLYLVDGSGRATALPHEDVSGPAAVMMPPQGVADPDQRGVTWVDNQLVVHLGGDGARAVLHPALDAVRELRAGPDGALVLKHVDNLEGDTIKIVWPATKEVTRVPSAMVGELPSVVGYVPDAVVLVQWVGNTTELRFLPWAKLAALPRTSYAELQEMRDKRLAAEAARKLKKLVARMDAYTEEYVKKLEDKPKVMKRDVVSHAEFGRGVVTHAPFGQSSFEVTFRDGTVRRFDRE